MRNLLLALLVVSVLALASWKGYGLWEWRRAEQQRAAAEESARANEVRAREEREQLVALRGEIRAKWGMEPEQVLNELSASFGNQPPCPEGWNAKCAAIWRRHADELFWPSYIPSLNTSQINARIAAPMPCRNPVPLTLKSWPTAELADPVLTFSRALKKSGATRRHWLALALDTETLEAAFQIAVREGDVRQEELNALRRAAIAQLFKPRAKTVVLMHNQAAPASLDAKYPPTLISMRHGEGRLVGMSLSMERGSGLDRLRPAVLMLEDHTCDVDVSYVVRVRVLFEECSSGLFGTDCRDVYDKLDFTFEGEGDLLQLLAGALHPHAPPLGSQPSPSGVSAKDIIGGVGFALRVVSLVRAGAGIVLPRR